MSRPTRFRGSLAAFVAVFVALAGGSEVARGHEDVRVRLCIPYYKGGPCTEGKAAAAYEYGDEVPIKGRVRPVHDGTIRIKRRKGSNPWRVVATPSITSKGRYRYVWHTRKRNADQGTPYKFKAILRGHDVSPVRKVAVLFGE